MAVSLPRFIVIQPSSEPSYVYHKDDGSVANGEETVFSPLVRIEVEVAKSNSRYIHLRFVHSNKYWQKSANDNSIVAVSNKPEEDTTKASCTLFQANIGVNSVSLTHVQTGWLVVEGASLGFEVKDTNTTHFMNYVDWDSLVKLPKHVAFMGDTGNYLKAYHYGARYNFLQFRFGDRDDNLSGYEVSLMRDGHVRIKSDHFNMFWVRTSDLTPGNWIRPESISAHHTDTLFWPARVDSSNSISLRNAANDKYCKRLTMAGFLNCLNADASSMTEKEAVLKVYELVTERKVYNVRYRMEDSRIFNEAPYLAGTTTVTNNSDVAVLHSVTIPYQYDKSYTFSNTLSLSGTGVAATIEANLPVIERSNVIDIGFPINTEFEWNKTTTIPTSVQATGAVEVPPRSVVTVSHVGTMGTCDVPFSYTVRDQSSVDEKITESDEIDGIYTGVNCYDFRFIVEKTVPV